MEASSGSISVDLPAGVKIGAGRETSQTNTQGQLIQGMAFPITTANGSTTTVFVPYTDLSNTAKAKQLIADRVSHIDAITG